MQTAALGPQIGQQVVGSLVPLVGPLGETLADDADDFGCGCGIEHRNRRGLVVENGVENPPSRFVGKGWLCCAHLIQHDSKREDVCSFIDFLAEDL